MPFVFFFPSCDFHWLSVPIILFQEVSFATLKVEESIKYKLRTDNPQHSEFLEIGNKKNIKLETLYTCVE